MNGLDSGPIWRYGGKGLIAPKLIPHFARAQTWAEPFFGAGGVFFQLPDRVYQRFAVNDLDSSIITFFRMLRDRPDDLVRVCELTPYAREEFELALERSDDELEEARRVWIRGRQGYAGHSNTVGDWARPCGTGWHPAAAFKKLVGFGAYVTSLRNVAVDCIDAAVFVEKWGTADAMLYADPPYVAESREPGTGGGAHRYRHEMDDNAHRGLAKELRAAAGRGAKVAVSGYASTLYDELFAGWRRIDFDVALHSTRETEGVKRTECLWVSYGERESIGGAKQKSLF